MELPPKCFERNPWRGTESFFTLSSMVTGKTSNPTLESLVKTETSSNDFLSGFIPVCQKHGEVKFHEALIGKLILTFRMMERALNSSWSSSRFTTMAVLSTPTAASGSRLTESDSALFRRGGTSTQKFRRFSGRGFDWSRSLLRFLGEYRAESPPMSSSSLSCRLAGVGPG